MLADLSEYFHIKEGFCHPDWDAISAIIEDRLPENEWNSGWEWAARSWVERIQSKLGGDYQINETENFMILSEAPSHVITDICRACEESLKRILTILDGVALDKGFGKRVVMMFGSIDDYYGYLSYFYPEGVSPMSGGVCLTDDGYVHFAFPTIDYSSYRTELVHELTHGCLVHLPIPIWLNEALAMRMEEVICDSNIFYLDQEIYNKHVIYWNAETIQQFWTGESWEIPGDSFDLSYNLAQILWRKIEVDLRIPRREIFKFILEAHLEDGGESACRAIFDISLGDLVAEFLGEGAWTPSS